MVYLQAKASNIQLPFVDPVVEFDIFTTHPTQLHMQQAQCYQYHLYFYVTKSGRNRNAGNGFWHASTSATAILNRKREVIGYRSMLVYYNNALNTNTKKRDRPKKTRWILHEYTLPEAHNMSSKGHKQPQQQSELIVLPDDVDEDDACIEDMENWIGNFDYCMDMIKELHDEVYDINGNSELEIDEQPFAKPSASSTRRIHLIKFFLEFKA
ncbi:hypothetical protein Sjap_025962 [Stephania japonica]|uniref:NAC domain-containing protein n=1 Tax=Stephania japonica TaxID=461633 RepID=A0AAP0E2R1_9MAGN